MNIFSVDRTRAEPRTGEPWGWRLALALAVVALVAFGLQSYGIASWPMADDEVPSLVELDILHNGADKFFSVPPDQIPKLPKATIVWNTFQRTAIRLLPAGEVSYRIPGLIFGVLTSILAFFVTARWRGLWYAVAGAILLNGSQTFVYLAPLNRFYALPLFLVTLTLAAFWLPGGNLLILAAVAALTVLAVLSHNIALVLLVLGFIAAVALYVIGRAPLQLVIRTGVAASLSVAIYVFYLLPLVRNWSSTGNPTPVLISFAAHAGMPALALALLGGWLALFRSDQGEFMLWWLLVFTGSFCVFLLTNMSWNPRYFVFFMIPMWILGAHAMEFVARRVGFGWLGVTWYGAVIVMVLPFLLSHLQDGSRHDYRSAAEVVRTYAHAGDPILSDDAETISYYLPADLITRLQVRTRVTVWPLSGFLVVCRQNAWAPQPRFPGRRVEVVAEISKRRLDQFSHILRIYRVAPAGT